MDQWIIGLIQAADKPNILFLLIDDFGTIHILFLIYRQKLYVTRIVTGWANVGWHNKDNPEIKTPNFDYLVENGLELNRHYAYYVCSPTRSSFQSGRLPCHVVEEQSLSEDDRGIPQNMTCLGTKMKQPGYETHIVGYVTVCIINCLSPFVYTQLIMMYVYKTSKWNCGFATYKHLPTSKLRGYDTSMIYLRCK